MLAREEGEVGETQLAQYPMSTGTARGEVLNSFLGAMGDELQLSRSQQLAWRRYGQFGCDHTRGEQAG